MGFRWGGFIIGETIHSCIDGSLSDSIRARYAVEGIGSESVGREGDFELGMRKGRGEALREGFN